MKNTCTLILRNSLLLFAILFTISSLPATAQTAPQPKLATPRITQAIDDTNLVTIHRSVYPLARSEYDQGAVADSLPVNRMLLVLQRSPEQETALRSLMDGQQTKSSQNYHAWLTPNQFGQQFGVADADIQKITDWLSQKGFTGARATGPGKMFIEFSGTAGTVRTAFHTELHNFLVNGEKHVANVSDPQIPAALAPVVARIHSLHDFQKRSFLHPSKVLARANADGKLKPAFGTGTGIFAVAPPDLAKIYSIPATVAGSPAGTGQTIAIVARGNINVSDINQFGSAFGLTNLTNFSAANNIIVNGPDPGVVPGDSDEATVDVEMVGSVAPNATILLVVNQGTLTGNLAQETEPTDGVDQSALYIVDNNLAPVMSQSFGSCEADSDTLFSSTLWEQAAAQGITVTVSTGDSGADVCDADQGDVESTAEFGGPSVSGSASTPFNVAVGGTDFNDASNPTTYWNNTAALETAKGYIPEMTWNNGCAATATSTTLNTVCTSVDPGGADLSGGSGGQSNCGVQNFNTDTCTGYPKPSWQSAPGVPADHVRDIPDVSLYAAVNSPSNNFYVICDSGENIVPGQPCNFTGSGTGYNFAGFGGTSLSTPAFAGMMALVNQSELAAGRGGRQGNANYVLYKLATAQTASACNSTTGPAATCTFNDVTVGNNSVICDPGSPSCSNQTATGFGVLVEPSTPNPPFSATTPAWTTTAGYDLATGLGSVNASNLIANWGTVTTNFKAATPAITSPASGTVSITHGTNQSFTITVTSASGTPTGDVSLIAEPPGFGQVGAGSATLSAGTATIVTNMLPGDDTTGAGTPYPIIAHYAGDGTFAPGDSAPINVTVNRENSTTVGTLYAEDLTTGFLSPTTSIQYGTDYIMIVDVVGATAGAICNNTSPTSITEIPTVPCPTGTITLKDNGLPLNDFLKTGANNTNSSTVGNLGFVEDLLIQLSGGSNPIVAAYSGDNSYNPSTSATDTISVTPGPTQSSVTANGASSASVGTGQSVTLVAVVSTNYTQACGNTGSGPTGTCPSVSNGAGPTGTVTFSACGTAASCTVPVVPTAFNATSGAGAFATATLTTTFSTVGQVTIVATYTTGDTNYTGSVSSGTSNATVTVTANQVGSFVVSYPPQPTALISSTGAATGTVITVTPSGGFTGPVMVTAGTLPPGVTCPNSPLTITVTGATAVTGTLNCQVTTTSSALSASNAREDRMLEAKTIPSTTPGKGWWSLSAGTGFAALFLLFLPGGRKKYRAALGLGLVCILSLTLGCNGAGSSTTPPPGLTATVTKMTVNNDKVATGTAFTFSVAVTGGTPTGQVELFDGATMIGTAATVAGGTAAPTAPALAVGTHMISAHYLGDTTTAASSSGVLNLTVTGPTTIAITTNPAATPVAAPLNITVN
jgi:pro-kumamolisin-like protein/Big-like domain-containing protein